MRTLSSIEPHTPLEKVFRLLPAQRAALARLGITTIQDLLFHLPSRYSDISELKSISGLSVHDKATVYARIVSLETGKAPIKKIPLAEGILEDHTGRIKAVWYSQPYIASMFQPGDTVKLEGQVQQRGKTIYFANPEIQKTDELPIDTANSLFGGETEHFSYAIYPESRGITSRWFYHAIQKILKTGVHKEIKDPIPSAVLSKYNLPPLSTALVWVHSPKKPEHAESARKRFAFEEVFFIQLERVRMRTNMEQYRTFPVRDTQEHTRDFLERLPFTLTAAQEHAIDQILTDMTKNKPMARLLEGDVGSGKTAVAAAVAYSVVNTRPDGQDFGNLQIAYMAPTEILAVQLFESFIEYFSHLPINIGLITGSGCRKFPSKVNPENWTNISRRQLLKWVESGEIAILIGTHSLIQKSVRFKHLALAIIDEQHRFGVRQRARLVQRAKGEAVSPHLLSMTATPIPRTLSLTIYGDLDLTLLDETPPGRKPCITEIVLPGKEKDMYETIQKELDAGRQAYVICPRIDEPDPDKELALNVKSVKAEAKRLKEKVFLKHTIDILHGKMTPKKKDETMKRFAEGEIDILVSTSVVEVGVNVPNATMIVIEGAERFGLSQLHQLRGRVLRSSHQAYCFVVSETRTKTSLDRLKALTKAKNGFELAEHDLMLRGAGELAGGKQWGVSDLGMEAIKNIKMVGAARTEARRILTEDPELSKHPLLAHRLAENTREIHLE